MTDCKHSPVKKHKTRFVYKDKREKEKRKSMSMSMDMNMSGSSQPAVPHVQVHGPVADAGIEIESGMESLSIQNNNNINTNNNNNIGNNINENNNANTFSPPPPPARQPDCEPEPIYEAEIEAEQEGSGYDIDKFVKEVVTMEAGGTDPENVSDYFKGKINFMKAHKSNMNTGVLTAADTLRHVEYNSTVNLCFQYLHSQKYVIFGCFFFLFLFFFCCEIFCVAYI